MSITEKLFGGKKGWQCSRNQDGSQTCSRTENDGDKILATGTSVTFNVDPQTCDVSLGGDTTRMLDDDEEDIRKMANSLKQGCQNSVRKGL